MILKKYIIVIFIIWSLLSSSLSALTSSEFTDGINTESLYTQAIEAIKEAQDNGKTNRAFSNIYIHYAGKFRDAGCHEFAQEFFELGLQKDPTNARGHRIYGDYLMGYRGFLGHYEYASYHYYQAQKHFDELGSYDTDPEDSDLDLEEERSRLSRSRDIMHRDGRDGIPLHRSDKFSVFLELSAAYRRNTPSTIDLLSEQNQIESFRDDTTASTLANDAFLDTLLVANGGTVTDRNETIDIIDIDGDGIAEPVSINDLQARNSDTRSRWDAFLENAPEDLVRRQEVKSFSASLLTRFGDPSLPYLRVTAERVETDKSSIEVDDPAPVITESVFDRAAITIGKNGFFSNTIDWIAELGVDWRVNQTDNPVTKNESDKEDTNAFTGRLGLVKSYPNQVLKFNISGSLFEINNNGDSDDAGNEASASIRYSIFPDPAKNTQVSERFRGRRSTHFEGGMRRTERIYKRSELGGSAAKEELYRPFFTYEEFGLSQGKIDLLFQYEYILREFKIKNTLSAEEGSFHAHEFTLTPTWVILYKLYDNRFRTGLEHMTLSFPFKVTFGDGKYDRVNFASRLFQRWTFQEFAIEAAATIDYNFYTVTSENDWGFFIEASLLSGAGTY